MPYAGGIVSAQVSPPYSVMLISGRMPGGLTLQTDGSILGTPTELARAQIRVEIADAHGARFQEDVTLNIVPAVASKVLGVAMVSPWGGTERMMFAGEGLNRGDVVRTLPQASVTLTTASGNVKVRANMTARVEADGKVVLSRVRGTRRMTRPDLQPLVGAAVLLVLVALLAAISVRRSIIDAGASAGLPEVVERERADTRAPRRGAEVGSLLREIRDENRRTGS